jgi:hypothetical protein
VTSKGLLLVALSVLFVKANGAFNHMLSYQPFVGKNHNYELKLILALWTVATSYIGQLATRLHKMHQMRC